MYLRRSHQYCLGYFSEEWEHVPPATWATTELYCQHAWEVALESTSQELNDQCCQPLLFSYQNSIPGTTSGHVSRCIGSIWEPGLSRIITVIIWNKHMAVTHYWSTISCLLVSQTVSSVWWPLNDGDSKRRTLDRMAKRCPWPFCRDLTYDNFLNFCNQDFDYWFMLNRGPLRVAAFKIGRG